MIHSGSISRWAGVCWMLLLTTPLAAQNPNTGVSSPTSSAIKAPQRQRRAVTSTRNASAPIQAEDDQDRASRMEIAAELNKSGVKVDWRRYDLLALLDLDSRVQSARHLRAMGVAVDWKQYDSVTLSDMELRVETARDLERQGVRVDWRKHDLMTLIDLQTRAETSQQPQPNKTTVKTRECQGGDNR
jgi:hypothetical protein